MAGVSCASPSTAHEVMMTEWAMRPHPSRAGMVAGVGAHGLGHTWVPRTFVLVPGEGAQAACLLLLW